MNYEHTHFLPSTVNLEEKKDEKATLILCQEPEEDCVFPSDTIEGYSYGQAGVQLMLNGYVLKPLEESVIRDLARNTTFVDLRSVIDHVMIGANSGNVENVALDIISSLVPVLKKFQEYPNSYLLRYPDRTPFLEQFKDDENPYWRKLYEDYKYYYSQTLDLYTKLINYTGYVVCYYYSPPVVYGTDVGIDYPLAREAEFALRINPYWDQRVMVNDHGYSRLYDSFEVQKHHLIDYRKAAQDSDNVESSLNDYYDDDVGLNRTPAYVELLDSADSFRAQLGQKIDIVDERFVMPKFKENHKKTREILPQLTESWVNIYFCQRTIEKIKEIIEGYETDVDFEDACNTMPLYTCYLYGQLLNGYLAGAYSDALYDCNFFYINQDNIHDFEFLKGVEVDGDVFEVDSDDTFLHEKKEKVMCDYFHAIRTKFDVIENNMDRIEQLAEIADRVSKARIEEIRQTEEGGGE